MKVTIIPNIVYVRVLIRKTHHLHHLHHLLDSGRYFVRELNYKHQNLNPFHPNPNWQPSDTQSETLQCNQLSGLGLHLSPVRCVQVASTIGTMATVRTLQSQADCRKVLTTWKPQPNGQLRHHTKHKANQRTPSRRPRTRTHRHDPEPVLPRQLASGAYRRSRWLACGSSPKRFCEFDSKGVREMKVDNAASDPIEVSECVEWLNAWLNLAGYGDVQLEPGLTAEQLRQQMVPIMKLAAASDRELQAQVESEAPAMSMSMGYAQKHQLALKYDRAKQATEAILASIKKSARARAFAQGQSQHIPRYRRVF